MKKDITELFMYVDDFCTQYEFYIKAHQLSNKSNRRPTRIASLSNSEIMTIIILFPAVSLCDLLSIVTKAI